MMKLTAEEIKAVRYYIGNTDGKDAFWSDSKAYVVLNALFFPGIATEQARATEGKFLNPEILADIDRLEHLLCALFSAFRKCALQKPEMSYRIERFSDYQIMKQTGRTISFTSTSTAGFLSAYQDRIGIAVMRFFLPVGTPCIIMREALAHYAKPEESELLLPPGLMLHFEEKPIQKEELQITDAEGNPPRVSCHVTVGALQTVSDIPDLPSDGAKAGQHVYHALQAGEMPDPEEVLLYTQWKSAFVKRIMRKF